MKQTSEISVSIVIATAYRWNALQNCLRSLAKQSAKLDEIIVADGEPASTIERKLATAGFLGTMPIRYLQCEYTGAAVQRNEGAELVTSDVVFFLDDDLYVQSDCIEQMLKVLQEDKQCKVGGVGCILTNEQVPLPSQRAKRWFDFLSDNKMDDYRGRVIGPAVNFYADPTMRESPIAVEWLNSGCTAYRREAFVQEKFDIEAFKGYSFMEDLDISLRIGRRWELLVETKARAYHDSQPSRFVRDFGRSSMAVRNRYHVMTNTMGRRAMKYHLKFYAHLFVTYSYSVLRVRNLKDLRRVILSGAGTLVGCFQIFPNVLRNISKAS